MLVTPLVEEQVELAATANPPLSAAWHVLQEVKVPPAETVEIVTADDVLIKATTMIACPEPVEVTVIVQDVLEQVVLLGC